MNTIRMTSHQFETLHDYLLSNEKIESAVFLIAGFFKNNNGYHFTVKDIIIPEDKDYDIRNEYHLQISPIFFNKAISHAEHNNVTVIQCHSHPFAIDNLQYSSSDFMGESISSKTIHDCLNKKPMGSLLFGKNSIIGRIWLLPDKDPIPLDQLRIIDRHIQFKNLSNTSIIQTDIDTDLFDRQIRAFGLKEQRILSNLKIGIVGVGGTGSAVAEQLAREGVKKFVLIDHDKFSKSNKTRMYGSYANTKGQNKVDIIKDNIKKIEPEAIVKPIAKDVICQGILNQLKNCDVIFSCTDRHAPRSVLNEIAHQFYVPVIDLGVGIEIKDGKIDGSVRVSLSSPSLPCLYCMGIINSDQIHAESLDEKERSLRIQEGYIQGMNDDVPSVITFTTLAASYAVFLLKDLFFNIIKSDANTFHLDIQSLKTSSLSSSIQNNCVCTVRFGKGNFMHLSAPGDDSNTDDDSEHINHSIIARIKNAILCKIFCLFNMHKVVGRNNARY